MTGKWRASWRRASYENSLYRFLAFLSDLMLRDGVPLLRKATKLCHERARREDLSMGRDSSTACHSASCAIGASPSRSSRAPAQPRCRPARDGLEVLDGYLLGGKKEAHTSCPSSTSRVRRLETPSQVHLIVLTLPRAVPLTSPLIEYGGNWSLVSGQMLMDSFWTPSNISTSFNGTGVVISGSREHEYPVRRLT
jgi:hypothetical protein